MKFRGYGRTEQTSRRPQLRSRRLIREGQTRTTALTRRKEIIAQMAVNAKLSHPGKSNGAYKHGLHGDPLFKKWKSMIARCTSEAHSSYCWYGGRGISVAPEWNDYENFKTWAQSSGYDPLLSLDRLDNDADYSPSNCRWATPAMQTRNRRVTISLTAWGETKPMAEWAEDVRCKVSYCTLQYRIQMGKSHELAISSPPHTVRSKG